MFFSRGLKNVKSPANINLPKPLKKEEAMRVLHCTAIPFCLTLRGDSEVPIDPVVLPSCIIRPDAIVPADTSSDEIGRDARSGE